MAEANKKYGRVLRRGRSRVHSVTMEVQGPARRTRSSAQKTLAKKNVERKQEVKAVQQPEPELVQPVLQNMTAPAPMPTTQREPVASSSQSASAGSQMRSAAPATHMSESYKFIERCFEMWKRIEIMTKTKLTIKTKRNKEFVQFLYKHLATLESPAQLVANIEQNWNDWTILVNDH